MRSRKQLSQEEKAEPELSYFGLQAYWGATKHFGGLKTTRELIELCHIDEGKYVLDVGCGVGITPCYIAKMYGCIVVGVDISERMVDMSNERAKREGVEDKVEFRIADAQNLPFDDGLFDAVISESVTAFLEDKQRGVSEYVRVTKPGGYVGLNEGVWMKAPPSDVVEYHFRTTGAKPETSDGWKELLEGSGLTDVVVRTYKINALSMFVNEIRRFDFKDYLRAWYRFLSLCIVSSAFRRLIRGYLPPKSIFKIFEYLGYGLYVGRKYE